jgi:hypothetical protein
MLKEGGLRSDEKLMKLSHTFTSNWKSKLQKVPQQLQGQGLTDDVAKPRNFAERGCQDIDNFYLQNKNVIKVSQWS